MFTLLRTAVTVALLLAFQAAAHAGVMDDHQGRWLGSMVIPKGPTLKIGAEFFTRADGVKWATAASPDQGSYNIPVATIKEDGDTVELDLNVATLKLTWVKDHFDGVFTQGGNAFPFVLHAVPEFPRKVRPQTPKGPFPYSSQDLVIASPDGVKLAATLTLPNNKARPNLVVLVPGSGPSSRDLDIAGHQPFAVIADYLARQGVAVLRYDKRGIAHSSGDYGKITTPQLVDDLGAIVKAMNARKQFKRVGMVGLSEGPGIAAAVAARDPAAVDFIVSMAGVGLPGDELILLQDRIVAKDNGAQPPEVERLMVYVRKYYETLMAHAEPQPRVAALKALRASLSAEDEALVKKYRMNVGSLSLGEAERPHLRTFLVGNPQNDWRAVRAPVLVLNGSL
ncbi:MAG TPA: alpha/beta fold hydrolase, partial [Telluria sp.]|nr:alpha/beta fold hydrolase [Telluria sp.]